MGTDFTIVTNPVTCSSDFNQLVAASEVYKMYISNLMGLIYPNYALLICEYQQLAEWNTLVNRAEKLDCMPRKGY